MVAVYIEDITEQKRMQTAILMANKKLNLLGTVTRHDTVNQLSVLMGNLEIASMKDPRSPLIKYLKKAIESGENIATILSFSKDYQLMGTEAPSLMSVRESCMRGIGTVDAKDVKVHIETGDLQVFADRMLEKVFLNLMDNSIRHGEKVKNIWVRSQTGGRTASMSSSRMTGWACRRRKRRRYSSSGTESTPVSASTWCGRYWASLTSPSEEDRIGRQRGPVRHACADRFVHRAMTPDGGTAKGAFSSYISSFYLPDKG